MSDGWDGLNDEGEEEKKDVEAEIALIRHEAAIIANCFGTQQGLLALDLLRLKTYRREGPDFLDFKDDEQRSAYLKFREGQLSIMRMIDNCIDIHSGKIKVE